MPVDLQQQLELDTLFAAIEQAIAQTMPGISLEMFWEELLQGSFALDWMHMLQQLVQLLCSEAVAQCSFLGQMILLAIGYALLRQMANGFADEAIQKVMRIMMQSIAILLVLKSGSAVLAYGQQSVVHLAELMQIFLPIQLGLMTALGNIQTAGLLQPSLMLIGQIAVWCFQTLLLPLVTFEFVLKLANSFSDFYQLQGLAGFLRKLILTGAAFSAMLLLAVLSIQGIGGHVMDSLSLRTVKYIAGTAIPVVGSTLSGLMETFLSGAAMIRNALGLLGLLLVIVLTVLPALKILVIYFMYVFVAAVLQPIGDNCITNLLEQAAGSYMLLFAIVALTGVFFFFMILIVLAASGAVLGG